MKKILATIVAIETFSILPCFSQTWIRPEEAPKHQGDIVNVIGLVTKVENLNDRQGCQMLLSLMTQNSKNSLRVVVCDGHRAEFSQPSQAKYLNQYVQVNGLVENHRRNPRMILRGEEQISILREAAPEGE